MVIRRYDPDDVTLQGVVTPSQDNQEEASEIPKHAELTGRHTSYRGGSPALHLHKSTGCDVQWGQSKVLFFANRFVFLCVSLKNQKPLGGSVRRALIPLICLGSDWDDGVAPFPHPLRQRRPTERPADVPRKGPILTAPQQRRQGITDATSILEQKSNTI